MSRAGDVFFTPDSAVAVTCVSWLFSAHSDNHDDGRLRNKKTLPKWRVCGLQHGYGSVSERHRKFKYLPEGQSLSHLLEAEKGENVEAKRLEFAGGSKAHWNSWAAEFRR